MSSSSDQAKTFRMLEQPCALRSRDESSDLQRAGRAYDLALTDSDYDAAEFWPAAPRNADGTARPPSGSNDNGRRRPQR